MGTIVVTGIQPSLRKRSLMCMMRPCLEPGIDLLGVKYTSGLKIKQTCVASKHRPEVPPLHQRLGYNVGVKVQLYEAIIEPKTNSWNELLEILDKDP